MAVDGTFKAKLAETLAELPFLSADQILAADDLATEEVPVPEWGGKVLVSTRPGIDRDDFQAQAWSVEDGQAVSHMDTYLQNFTAKLVAFAVIDPNTRRPLFSEEQIAALGRKSPSALDRVAKVARKLNGFGEQEVEEILKNFVSARNAASGSGSPVSSVTSPFVPASEPLTPESSSSGEPT